MDARGANRWCGKDQVEARRLTLAALAGIVVAVVTGCGSSSTATFNRVSLKTCIENAGAATMSLVDVDRANGDFVPGATASELEARLPQANRSAVPRR